MKSTKERETGLYRRNTAICFLCIAICVFVDVKKYIAAGKISFDRDFVISLILYILLIFLAIRNINQSRKCRSDHETSDEP